MSTRLEKHIASVSKSITLSEQKNADRRTAAIAKNKDSFVSADLICYDGIQLLKGGIALFVNRSTSRQMETVADGVKFRETRYSCALAFAESFESAAKITASGLIGKVTIIVVDNKVTAASGSKMSLTCVSDALKIGTRFCPSYKVNKQ